MELHGDRCGDLVYSEPAAIPVYPALLRPWCCTLRPEIGLRKLTIMQSAPPNVLVFFTDQQRWDSTGVHGNPLDLTLNFDRMALSGTHVYHSFTAQPVCGPARSCFQTGMYATQTGCYRNDIPLHPDSRTLAHYFRE